MLKSPDAYPADSLLREALSNGEFQKWLFTVGLLKMDPKEVIDHFRDSVPQMGFTPREALVIDSHEPFGFLTTYTQVSTNMYGWDGDTNACRTTFGRAMGKIRRYYAELPDSGPITLPRPSKILRSIGGNTKLTSTELILAYLIPWREDAPPVTYSGLNEKLNPNLPQSILTEFGNHSITVHLSRLRRKLPEGLAIESRSWKGYIRAFSWSRLYRA